MPVSKPTNAVFEASHWQQFSVWHWLADVGGVGGGVGGTGVGVGGPLDSLVQCIGVLPGFQLQLARVQCALSVHSEHCAPVHDGWQLWPLLPSASGPSPFWHLVVEVGYQ